MCGIYSQDYGRIKESIDYTELINKCFHSFSYNRWDVKYLVGRIRELEKTSTGLAS